MAGVIGDLINEVRTPDRRGSEMFCAGSQQTVHTSLFVRIYLSAATSNQPAQEKAESRAFWLPKIDLTCLLVHPLRNAQKLGAG